MAEYEVQTRRFTRAEYDQLIELGIFQPGEPIELIGGQLMVAEPQGEYHYGAIWKTAHALEAAFGSSWYVRTQAPIGLDDESEPEPDVAVVPGSVADYRDHPSRPALTVEVAESSLAMDRRHKGSLYARAGSVPDADTPFGWRYARREVLDPSMTATPLAAPHATIRIADLLP